MPALVSVKMSIPPDPLVDSDSPYVTVLPSFDPVWHQSVEFTLLDTPERHGKLSSHVFKGSAMTPQIKGMHHTAFRCRDSEATREFYEDFLELPLAEALEIGITKTGRQEQYLHTFYRMANGSFMAFFECPSMEFEFKDQHDFDMHIALEVELDYLHYMKGKAVQEGRECRGPADHTFIQSIYFRDPNGYVVELTAKTEAHDDAVDPSKNGAREKLARWTKAKRDAGYGPDAEPGNIRIETGARLHGTAGETL